MLRTIFLALLLLAPARLASAQGFGCPSDVHQQVYDLTEMARAGELTPQEAGEKATDILRGCGADRVIFAQFLEMFTVAGLAIEPPSADRFGAHLNAIRTVNRIMQTGGAPFDPITLKSADSGAIEWSDFDERNAYWDLMFAVSSDFLVHGVHADLYTPGKLEQVGCGLYPAEEASALARHGEDNVDGGELVARVAFLGRECDTPEHETSGYAAEYFAAHYRARAGDPGYIGLTTGDIRYGLRTFLAKHLDGAPDSALFSADVAAALLEFGAD